VMSKFEVKFQVQSQVESQVESLVKFEIKFYHIEKLTTFETNCTKYLQSRTYIKNPFPPPTSSVA
jgi:hypothetical protein